MGLEDLARKQSSSSSDSSTEEEEQPDSLEEDHGQQTPFNSDSPDDEIPRSKKEHDDGPQYTRNGEKLPAKAPCPRCDTVGDIATTDSGEPLWYYRCDVPHDECELVTFTRPDNIDELREQHGTDYGSEQDDDFLEDWDEYLDETDIEY